MRTDIRFLEPPDPVDHEMSPAYKPPRDHAECAFCGEEVHVSAMHEKGNELICHTCWLDDGL